MGRKQSTTPDLDTKIYVERLGERTWDEISKKFGVTISTARRAAKRAEEALKKDQDEFYENYANKETETSTETSTVVSETFLQKISNFFKGLFN